MVWFIVYISLCFLVSWLGSQKNRSGVAWFFVALFFSPVIGLLAVIAVPSRVPEVRPETVFKPIEERRPEKKCPACAEMILAEARKCRYCGSDLTASEVEADEPPPTMGYCPGCGRLRASNVRKCLYCSDTAPVLSAPPDRKGQSVA